MSLGLRLMTRRIASIGFIVFFVVLVMPSVQVCSAQSLKAEFANPPAGSRMASYWWVFGPAWTKPEIKRELNVFRKAGIGRILIYPLYPYVVSNPAKGIYNQKYLSPKFLATLRYAVDTAHQMSIQCDLVMGSGWPYGGHQIPESLSPERIFERTSNVTGTQGSETTIELPRLQQYEKIISVQLVPEGGVSSGHLPIDLTGKVQSPGKVTFRVPAGQWQLMTVIEGPTTGRHEVIFAAVGGGGNVIDHLNRKAVNLYLRTVCDKLGQAVQGKIRTMYCPSFEVYGTCWTPGFLSDFRKLRGYNLRPYLPALFQNEGNLTRQIRYDFWNTVSELANDHFMGTISNWCHTHGFRFQAESYGEPPVTQRSYSYTDYPMGEEYDWKEFNMVRWTSSAAHFYDKRIISDEAYTWLMDPARYNASLQELKYTSDAIFVSGANRLVAHGYGYSPPSAGIPGWGYFAGVMLSEHQPWWPYFHFLSAYVHRTGFMLSEGKPVTDVLVYLPEGDIYADNPPGSMPLAWWVEGRLDRHRKQLPDYGIPRGVFKLKSNLIDTIVRNGYSLDGIDNSVLSTQGKIVSGHMEIGEGDYRIVILPGLQGIPLKDFERVVEFCRSGGTVITTLRVPSTAYGYMNHSEDARRFQALKDELYGGMNENLSYQVKSVSSGKSIFVKDETNDLLKALNAALPPDVVFGSDPDIGFVHRRVGDKDFYFVANISRHDKHLEASFRVGNRTPQFWNPMTGKISHSTDYRYSGDRTVVPLHLAPYESMFVEFGASHMQPSRNKNESWQTERTIPVKGPWKVEWIGSKVPSVEMTRLKSWTDYPSARYFSGKAQYQTNVRVPQRLFAKGSKFVLDLGDVKETADVWINGKHVGVAWMLPYKLNVTSYLRPGNNSVRIDVTNLLINYVLSQPAKSYAKVESTYHLLYKIHPPEEKEFIKSPYPSGLLGPVRIEQEARD